MTLISNNLKQFIRFSRSKFLYTLRFSFNSFITLLVLFLFPFRLFFFHNRIVYFYDRRICTYRFDLLDGLLWSHSYASYQCKKLTVVLYDPYGGVRIDGPDVSTNDKRLNLLTNIFFEGLSLVSSKDDIIYIRNLPLLYFLWLFYLPINSLPKGYNPIFPNRRYTVFELIYDSKKFNFNPLSYTESDIYKELINKYLNNNQISKYITITIRNKSWEHTDWNTDQASFTKLIDELNKLYNKFNFTLIIIPDYEDIYNDSIYIPIKNAKFRYIYSHESALSIRFRFSIYKNSLLNIASTNGPTCLLLESECVNFYVNQDDMKDRMTEKNDFSIFWQNNYIFDSFEDLKMEHFLKVLSPYFNQPKEMK